jgi:hypothetical protein
MARGNGHQQQHRLLAEVPDVQFEVGFEVTRPMPARHVIAKKSKKKNAYRKYIFEGGVFFLPWKNRLC